MSVFKARSFLGRGLGAAETSESIRGTHTIKKARVKKDAVTFFIFLKIKPPQKHDCFFAENPTVYGVGRVKAGAAHKGQLDINAN